VYRARDVGRAPGVAALCDDRLVVDVSDAGDVRYHSPGIADRNHPATVGLDAWAAWVDYDVTDTLNNGEWADYPPPKEPS
jgi:hypothetical protein